MIATSYPSISEERSSWAAVLDASPVGGVGCFAVGGSGKRQNP